MAARVHKLVERRIGEKGAKKTPANCWRRQKPLENMPSFKLYLLWINFSLYLNIPHILSVRAAHTKQSEKENEIKRTKHSPPAPTSHSISLYLLIVGKKFDKQNLFLRHFRQLQRVIIMI